MVQLGDNWGHQNLVTSNNTSMKDHLSSVAIFPINKVFVQGVGILPESVQFQSRVKLFQNPECRCIQSYFDGALVEQKR